MELRVNSQRPNAPGAQQIVSFIKKFIFLGKISAVSWTFPRIPEDCNNAC